MKIRSAMLMFAGLGTRLKPFTEHVPKPLIPLMGIPCAQYAIDALVDAGVERIVVNVHHLPELSREGLSGLDFGPAQLLISDESKELLGSAGGLRHARALLGEDAFFLLNADVLSSVPLAALAEQHEKNRGSFGATMTLSLVERSADDGANFAGERPSYREIFTDSAGVRVTGRGELKRGVPFFSGAAVIESAALRHVPANGPADFLSTILDPGIQAGTVGCHLMSSRRDGDRVMWLDVGSPGLWLEAHFALISQLERLEQTEGSGNAIWPERWTERLLRLNDKISNGIWKRKNPQPFQGVINRHVGGWKAPAYWGSTDEADAPRGLGPMEVCYGLRQGPQNSRQMTWGGITWRETKVS